MAETTFFIGIDHPAIGALTGGPTRVSVPMTVPFDLVTQILPWLASVHAQTQMVDANGAPAVDADGKPVYPSTPLDFLRCLAKGTGDGHSASVARFVADAQRAAIQTPAHEVALGAPVIG